MKISKDRIKVSVTMPAYNASEFIKDAIESVLSQDYNNFELLIIDDGSTDNTFEIIKRYKNHLKVRYYRNRENVGSGVTRNKMLRLARGEYISPCDDDDIMLPGNLKTLSRFLNTHPDIGAVYGDILIVEIDNIGRIKRPPFAEGKDCNKGWDLIEDNPLINHSGSMIRKSLMLNVGGYDETVCMDDWSLWLKLAEITKIRYLEGEIYYVWRRHSKSLTHSYMARRYKSDVARIKEEAINRRYDFKFKN